MGRESWYRWRYQRSSRRYDMRDIIKHKVFMLYIDLSARYGMLYIDHI